MAPILLKRVPVVLLLALGSGVTQFQVSGALAPSLHLVAQAKAPAATADSVNDGHNHGAKAVNAGVLDEATVNSMRAVSSPSQVKPEVAATVVKLTSSAEVCQALSLLKSDEARFIKEAIQISDIPAPTFEEAKRAQADAALLKSNGLADVHIDSISNVIGVPKGSGNGPKIAIVTHLDTVLDAKTDVKVKKKGDVFMAQD
jgi:hypothetical protein